MASVTLIRGKWRALVRLAGHPPRSKYCATKGEAETWGEAVEAALRGAVRRREMTVADVIADYRKLRLDAGRPIAPENNEHYMLNGLERDLGDEPVSALDPSRLQRWAVVRRADGAGPYTVNMDLSKLGTMLRYVAASAGVDFPDVVGRARPLLHHLQLIGGGNRRQRRVLDDEFAALLDFFADRPVVQDLLRVARITGMRRGELVRITWADLDAKHRAVLVRKRKNPRATRARDQWVPLLGEAWRIVAAQTKRDERIFPLHPQTLTKAFTDAVRVLGIPDLHLHDLRHEASSRLQEAGFDVSQRMAILGHETERQNVRYTHPDLTVLHRKYDSAQRPGKQPRRARPQKPARHRHT